MAVTVKIESVDVTSKVRWGSLVVDRNIGATVDTAQFQANDMTGLTPSFGDEVEVWDGTTKVFGGSVVSVSESAISGPEGNLLNVSCVDYTPELDRELISKTYESETIADIIADMAADCAPAFTTAGVASDFEISKIVFNQVPMTQAIQKLADTVGFDWFVDVDRDIKFRPRFDLSAPYDLTDGNYMPLRLTRTEDGSQVANRVKVRGGEYDGDTFSDSITVKGDATLSFRLPYRFANLTVTLNGAPQSVGIDFINDFTTDDVLYNFAEQTIRFETVLSDDDVIGFSGNPKVGVFAIAEDPASVALYGVREKLIRDTSIASNEQARKRALAELYETAEPVVDVKVSVYASGVEPGMTMLYTERGHDDELTVKRVRYSMRDHQSFKYELNLISARKYEFIDYLRKSLAPDPKVSDESETSENIIAITDSVTVTELVQKVEPEELSETVTVAENLVLDPFGDDTDATYVLAPYVPTGQTDTLRKGRLGISLVTY
jgi:hypothetical protein